MDGDNYLRGLSSLLSSCWGCHHPSAGGDGRVIVAVVLVLVSAGPRPRHCRFRHCYQHHRVGVEGRHRHCPGGGNGHVVDAGGDRQPTSLAVVIVPGCGGHWRSCLDIADGTGSDRHRQRSSTVRG